MQPGSQIAERVTGVTTQLTLSKPLPDLLAMLWAVLAQVNPHSVCDRTDAGPGLTHPVDVDAGAYQPHGKKK